MRTTLTIDDDVLAAAKELAAAGTESVGAVISGLARTGLRSDEANRKTRTGVPLLPVRTGIVCVTSELVGQLRDELRVGDDTAR